jgi:outer membrane protein assembly factor BamB
MSFPKTLNSPIYTSNYAECIFASYTTGTLTSNPSPTAAATPPTTNNGAADWPMFHNDLNHSGYSAFSGPTTNQILWIHQISSAVLSSPAVANGIVYVGSNSGAIYALDASSGNLLWLYQTGGAIYSTPAVANGVVYTGSWDEHLRFERY